MIVRTSFASTLVALCFLVAATVVSSGQDTSGPSAQFVGSQVCSTCHQTESELWSNSHHAHAMLVADEISVLAPFEGETFTKDGVTSTFFKRDGKYLVNTDGPDGQLQDYEISYTFGFTPLQQYLIAFPDGRFQTLGIAWDTRPESEDGQRWFHLYPDQTLTAGNPLHWTGIDQNWNYQCAWCHSTDLRKNYDPVADRYSTTWSEINVGCESCHGPGSDHVAWAQEPEADRTPAGDGAGFATRFDERADISWMTTSSGTARRSTPRMTSKEIDVCAGCHARRGQFTDDPHHTAGFLDAFRPALIEPGLYFADGQQRDEVYKHGSFLQSKMHAEGVTCSDCHDPHSGETLLEGNALCSQCHEPEKFDTADHHHHPLDSDGAKCVSCHMPTTNYMIVDARHDHSLRIPMPELTVAFSIPNACNGCHTDSDAAWAVETLDGWYPERKTGFQDFARIFATFDRGKPGAREALIRYLDAKDRPAIVVASALNRLALLPSQETLTKAVEYLASPDPLVRWSAINVITLADPQLRLSLLAPLLSDDSRLVRMEAARTLAGQPESLMDGPTRQAFNDALAEYVAGQLFNADRPETNANLASLSLERGDLEQARNYFDTALKRDPSFVPAIIGRAGIFRQQGNEAAAAQLLREAADAQPQSPDLIHAYGLSLVRAGARNEAMGWLREAARLGQDNPRFAYVYAVALHDTGRAAEAIVALRTTLLRHPGDRDILRTLLFYQIEESDWPGALETATTLAALEPGDSALRNLLPQLRERQ